MFDLVVEWSCAAAVAWLVTRRASPAQASAAHRLWLLVLAYPLLWLAAGRLVPTIAFVQPGAALSAAADTLPLDRLSIWAIGAYLVVAAALLARTIHGVWSVRRLLRGSRPLPDADAAALGRMLGGRPCEIREADVDLPLTAGFVRPSILLPRNWRTINPDGLRAILLHEAAHVRRRDCSTALACAILESVAWFNPLIWLATSRIRWFAELACDDQAARAMEGDSYASELLALAADWTRARRPLFAITAGAETDVARRIELLIDGAIARRGSVAITAAAVLLLIAMPVAAAIHVTPQRTGTGGDSSGSFFDHDARHSLRHGH